MDGNKNRKTNGERALLKVKPTYRAVFILRAINELSIKETAEVLGYSESKVKVTYLRAIKKLQTLLHIEWEEWKHESTN
ncbi:RNA polymerase sigma factor (plasmid) [Priestia megaterium]